MSFSLSTNGRSASILEVSSINKVIHRRGVEYLSKMSESSFIKFSEMLEDKTVQKPTHTKMPMFMPLMPMETSLIAIRANKGENNSI